jgi:hypothetical protein
MQQGLQRLNQDMGGDSHIHNSKQLTQWCRDYWSLAARAGLNRFAPVLYSEHSDERSAYNFLRHALYTSIMFNEHALTIEIKEAFQLLATDDPYHERKVRKRVVNITSFLSKLLSRALWI